MDPAEALDEIATLLERGRESRYKAQAFRHAAETVRELPPGELDELASANALESLPGIGKATAEVIAQAIADQVPDYLHRLSGTATEIKAGPGRPILEALRGDLHSHSDWSDGGSPIEAMAEAARAIGHDYWALTDHSPRLTIAHGLNRERLLEQLAIVERLNEAMTPFRILTGIEVDILDDGALDQSEDLLARLDVVVASVHSKLRMDARQMTKRMVAAIASPHVDILGHCTGRIVVGKGRPESEFDAELVFAAAAQFDTAIEINSRPERLDPPKRLVRMALDAGCQFSIDTDAHAPGQLQWQPFGADRAAECGVPIERIVNTWALDDLLAWTASHAA